VLRPLSAMLAGALVLGLAFLHPGSASAAPDLAAQSSDDAGVLVVVTPTALGPDATVWEFEVAMDTHSQALDADISQVAVLVDEAGRRYAPLAWEGDPPGGHHRKGILRFAAPADMSGVVELQIEGVGGAGTRTFRWELK